MFRFDMKMKQLKRWKPSTIQEERLISANPTLAEVFIQMVGDTAALGFVLAQLASGVAPILWVQDRVSRKEAGRPCLAGIGMERPIILVDLSRAGDVLWAMEGGLQCKTLAAVIGEVWGDPVALNFTATKRLAMQSEAAGVPCWLIRHAASPNVSAARARWRISSLSSLPHPDDPKAPGMPRWSLDLFRARHTKPGQWVATYDRTSGRLDLTPALRDGAMDAGDGAAGQRAAG